MYLLGRKQRHPRNNPSSLTGPQDEKLVNAQLLHHLQIHDCGIPVGEMLRLGPCLAMAQQVNGDEVDEAGEVGVCELGLEEGGSGHEGVDHDQCRF